MDRIKCNAVASHYFPSRGCDSSMAELITIASCSHFDLNDIYLIEIRSKDAGKITVTRNLIVIGEDLNEKVQSCPGTDLLYK